MDQYAIGVDLGGTFIKAGVVGPLGQVRARTSIDTNAAGGRDEVVSRIVRAAEAVAAQAGLSLDDAIGIGLGSPGVMNLDEGIVITSPNLVCVEGECLPELVEERIQSGSVRVLLENDANAAAWGEKWAGVGRNVSTMVLFTLGTGIGGGLILNNEIWHGSNDVAAELGHQTVDLNGPLCGCGNRGCIEALASAPGTVRRLREAIENGKPSVLSEGLSAGREVTCKDIYEAALAGDATAREIIEETGRYLAVAATNMLHILNPEMVVFVGGMTGAGDMLLNPIREEVKRRAFAPSFEGVQIVFGSLGNDAGLIGAAGCAFKAFGTSASSRT